MGCRRHSSPERSVNDKESGDEPVYGESQIKETIGYRKDSPLGKKVWLESRRKETRNDGWFIGVIATHIPWLKPHGTVHWLELFKNTGSCFG